MPVLIIDQEEVRRLLPMSECMEVMKEALISLAREKVVLPLRTLMWLPDRSGLLGMMPAYSGEPTALGLKVVTVFPGNHGTELDSHQGAVILFDPQNGRLLAIMDGSEITAVRTAAVSGVATQLLARADAKILALIGSGVQARVHLEAMLLSRSIERVRIWSRHVENAETFARSMSSKLDIPIELSPTARDAVSGADIVCTVTAAREPVVLGDWISAGTHINAVGSSVPSSRELDTAAMLRSRLFVDRRESTTNEAGDFLVPKQEGAINDDHIVGEIGDLLLGAKGRESEAEITVFKSLGLAVEDVASARHIYDKAMAQGAGIRIELGGRRPI